jgi:hypothetical protein
MQKFVKLPAVVLFLGSVCCPSLQAEPPAIPEGQQSVELVLNVGSDFGARQRYTFQVDQPGVLDIFCTWTGSAHRLTGLLHVNETLIERTDQGSPIHISHEVTDEDIQLPLDVSVTVANFGGGEAQGTLRISFPSEEKSITISQVNHNYVLRVLTLPEDERDVIRGRFDEIDYALIADANFSDERINGHNDERNELLPGSIFFCKTTEGRLAKFLIEEYGYHLVISWTTYNHDGEVYSEGSGLRIRGTWSCDLDEGKESTDGRDFWWQQVTDVERYLTPKNGAVFATYSP